MRRLQAAYNRSLGAKARCAAHCLVLYVSLLSLGGGPIYSRGLWPEGVNTGGMN